MFQDKLLFGIRPFSWSDNGLSVVINENFLID